MLRIRCASSGDGCLLSDLSSLEGDAVNESEDGNVLNRDCQTRLSHHSEASCTSEPSSETNSWCHPLLTLSMENVSAAQGPKRVQNQAMNFAANKTDTSEDRDAQGTFNATSTRGEGSSNTSFSNTSFSTSQSCKPDASFKFASRSISQVSMQAEELYSLDTAIDHLGFGRFQVKLMFVVGLSWLADAMEMMLLSVLSPALKCSWYLTTVQEALITTAVFVGMMLGAGGFGWLCDVYGRKKGLYFSIFWVMVFGILSSQAPFYMWIIVLRFLVGFGIGGSAQSVTLVTELLPSSIRGKCVILLELFWAFGTCFAVVLAITTMPTLGWRWFLGLSTIPLFIFLIAGLWLPESPRYLITAGRFNDAVKVLHRIAKDNRKEVPEGQLIVSDIQVPRGKITDLLGKEWRFLTIILWTIWFTCSFCYYGMVLLTTETFQTGINSCHPYPAHHTNYRCDCKVLGVRDYVDFMWTSVAEFPGVILTFFIIEKLGRRRTMIAEFLLASVFLLLMFICSTRGVFVAFMFGARALVTGVFQAAYVYTPEVFPTTVRAIGLGTCSSIGRIGAMLTPFVAQVLLSASFYYALGVYLLLAIICAVLAGCLPLETKGRPLEDTTESESVAVSKLGYNRLK